MSQIQKQNSFYDNVIEDFSKQSRRIDLCFNIVLSTTTLLQVGINKNIKKDTIFFFFYLTNN